MRYPTSIAEAYFILWKSFASRLNSTEAMTACLWKTYDNDPDFYDGCGDTRTTQHHFHRVRLCRPVEGARRRFGPGNAEALAPNRPYDRRMTSTESSPIIL